MPFKAIKATALVQPNDTFISFSTSILFANNTSSWFTWPCIVPAAVESDVSRQIYMPASTCSVSLRWIYKAYSDFSPKLDVSDRLLWMQSAVKFPSCNHWYSQNVQYQWPPPFLWTYARSVAWQHLVQYVYTSHVFWSKKIFLAPSVLFSRTVPIATYHIWLKVFRSLQLVKKLSKYICCLIGSDFCDNFNKF